MNNTLSLLILCSILASCSGYSDESSGQKIIFTHGVASGDPYPGSIVLWTRSVPEDSSKSVTLTWELSESEDFSFISRAGNASALATGDYTCKVIADSLKPGTKYYYRFRTAGSTSVTGQTRTAPAGKTDSVRFAVVSCSNYEWGYFNAYGSIAEITDLDAVLHLGDYIYEYGTGVYGDTTLGRKHNPSHEIISLEDYRQRYAQYRSDPDLQRLHQVHPFITIWDDHEIANNAYVEGAQNHQQEEGDYEIRKQTARRVYYEWMPVRETPELYRSFTFGEIADLFMLDERLAGRTAPVENTDSENYGDSSRAILGTRQFDWLEQGLKSSGARWQVIGNQVIFSYLNWSDSGIVRNMDAWDGYPAEQARLAQEIRSLDNKNVVIVTGDTHSSWAFEVMINPFDQQPDRSAFALEFGVTSVNSANSNEQYSDEEVITREKQITSTQVNPHLKFSNLRDHGYLLLRLGEVAGFADYYFVNTVREPDDSVYLAMRFKFEAGTHTLEETSR